MGIVWRMSVRDLTRYDKFPVRQFDGIDSFIGARVPEGVATISYNGGLLDLLVRRHPGATTTLVAFHAAVKQEATRPIFSGLGVTGGLSANVIFVSDPTLEMRDDVTLAWFAGNWRQRLQVDLTTLFRGIFNTLATPHRIFFGGSGGGFASLYYSSRFAGSLAVACNPQTSMSKFSPITVTRYVDAAFGIEGNLSAAIARLDTGGVVHDLCDHYRTPHGNTVAYLQNLPDARHVTRHLIPFYDSVSSETAVGYLLGNWGPGHYPPPKETVMSVLAAAVTADGQWEQMLSAEGFMSNIPRDELSGMQIGEADGEAGWVVV